MIEADIVYGCLKDDPEILLPVMGHPPANESDISLENFLSQIDDFNVKNPQENRKGVKLDFKSTDVFENSLPILLDVWGRVNFPIWINADIYPGPVNNVATSPVDAQAFFDGVKQLSNATLSTGWTTRWGADFREGNYTMEQVEAMISGIKKNKIKNDLTFPVRAGIAAQSIPELKHLYKSLNATNAVTFTIWSSDNDFVDIGKLRQFIFEFGVEKVYIDVPKAVSDQLDLGNQLSGAGTSAVSAVVVALASALLLLSF